MGPTLSKKDDEILPSLGLQSSSRRVNGISYDASEMPLGSTESSIHDFGMAAQPRDYHPLRRVQSASNVSAIERRLVRNMSVGCPAREARIVFGNMSDLVVSYWVLQEHKIQTTKIHQEVVTMVNACLNAGAANSLMGSAGRRHERTVDNNVASYFVMTDARIAPSAGMKGTHLNFPHDCTDLRVLGFFNMPGKNDFWKRFKNKVYSIDRGKKIFKVAPSNSNIRPYM